MTYKHKLELLHEMLPGTVNLLLSTHAESYAEMAECSVIKHELPTRARADARVEFTNYNGFTASTTLHALEIIHTRDTLSEIEIIY